MDQGNVNAPFRAWCHATRSDHIHAMGCQPGPVSTDQVKPGRPDRSDHLDCRG
jgi:hypothetical protein